MKSAPGTGEGEASIEIEITPPGPDGTAPWWTVLWDGTRATVQIIADIDGDEPDDWGIHCTSPDYTDAWRAEGGNTYVVEQILDAVDSAGATARIVALHGTAQARQDLITALQAFADEHPQCAAELRRFAMETQ